MYKGVMSAVTKVSLAVAGLGLASAAFGLQANDHPPAAAGKAPAVASAPAVADATVTKGRQLFSDWSCSSCHSLADAGATGHVGPSLDGDTSLTEAFVVNRVTNGQGAMPAFGGQLSDEEIALLAKYITKVAAK